jgi:Ni,Fe-hydrogenase I small subunit
MQPGVYQEVRPIHVCFGDLRGRQIDAAPNERVIFMGDCAMFEGEISGKQVKIESTYVNRELKNPRQAKSGDLLAKIVKFIGLWIGHLGKQVIRVPGCPVSVAENTFLVSAAGKTKLPYLDREIFVNFAYHYVIFNVVRFFRVTLPGIFKR